MEVLTRITTIDIPPTSECISIEWSHNNKFLVVTTVDEPFLYIYKNNFDETFTLLNSIDIYPPFISYGSSFSRDDSFLAVIHEGNPYLTIYKVNNDILTFTKIANPSEIPTSSPRCCKFNPNGNHLIIGKSEYPFFGIYYNNGNVFGKITTPLIVPTGKVNNIAFNSDGTYVTLVHDYYPYKTTYQIALNTFTIIEDDDVIISGEGIDAVYSTDFNNLIVINKDSLLEDGNFLTIYSINSPVTEGQTDINLANLNFVVTDKGFLYARNAVIEGKMNVIEGSYIAGNTIINNYFYGENAGVGTGSSDPNNPDSVTNIVFWAGDTFDNREYAEFRVYNDGRVYMTNAYVEGKIYATELYLGGVNILNIAGDMFNETFMSTLSENIAVGIFVDRIVDKDDFLNVVSIYSNYAAIVPPTIPPTIEKTGLTVDFTDGINHWALITKKNDSIIGSNPLIGGTSFGLAFAANLDIITDDDYIIKNFAGTQTTYAFGQWNFENAIVESNSYFESAQVPWDTGIIEYVLENQYSEQPIYLVHPTATTEAIFDINPLSPTGKVYRAIQITPTGGSSGQIYNLIAFCRNKYVAI